MDTGEGIEQLSEGPRLVCLQQLRVFTDVCIAHLNGAFLEHSTTAVMVQGDNETRNVTLAELDDRGSDTGSPTQSRQRHGSASSNRTYRTPARVLQQQYTTTDTTTTSNEAYAASGYPNVCSVDSFDDVVDRDSPIRRRGSMIEHVYHTHLCHQLCLRHPATRRRSSITRPLRSLSSRMQYICYQYIQQ